MKKIFIKFKNNLKDSGSSLILVIVALGFVGILTGSLLMAVAYAYRQKLYDYNAKSNFYYLEQAMDEVYSGVGSKTMEYMQAAYEETKEKAVKYNQSTHEYENIGNENANLMFKDAFMNKFSDAVSDPSNPDDTFVIKRVGDVADGEVDTTRGLGKTIVDCISNYKDPSDPDTKGTISLVPDDLVVLYYYYGSDSPSTIPLSSGQLNKVVIKNVTLRRTASYNRSNANGDFKQTISTDIEISRPDFDVNFDGTNTNINNLFEFCLVADSGVEVNKQAGSVLSINGNIYASNDFYNKTYNNYDNSNTSAYKADLTWKRSDGTEKTYSMSPVSNYQYVDNSNTSLYNKNDLSNAVTLEKALYDGNNLKSRYSGFYVNGSNVNVFANKMIVPGSIAVMDSGDLSVYGLNGTDITQSNVWADEVVLAGSTRGLPTYDSNANINGLVAEGSKNGARAEFTANMYIKDDTQIESDYSRFRLNGSYYGYGNSTAVDTRKFIPTTLISSGKNGGNIYEEYGNLGAGKGDGNKIRSHYNSSAFIVNGEHANVNLFDTESIYIAGRSYIELSKVKTKKNEVNFKVVDPEPGSVLADQPTQAAKITTSTLSYDSDIQDYKTGESLSIKSNQLAYKPSSAPVKEKYVKDPYGHYTVRAAENYTGNDYIEVTYSYLPDDLKNMVLFTKYFNTALTSVETGGKVPVVYVEEEYTVPGSNPAKKATKYYYYLDFQFSYDNELYDHNKFTKNQADATATKQYIQSADDLSKAFITDYYHFLAYIDEFDTYGIAAFIASHTGVDTDILGDHNTVTIGGTEFTRTDTLVNLMDYEDYKAGAIGTDDDNVYASGAVTTSFKKLATGDMGSQATSVDIKNALTSENNVTFFVQTKTDAVIKSTNLGPDPDTVSTTEITDSSSAMDLSEEYEEHYNYMKWSLQDLPTADSTLPDSMTESQFVRHLVDEKGANSLTPLNSYFNFDTIKQSDPDLGNTPTSISPENLRLSYNAIEGYSEYKVYVDYNDIHISCESPAENGSITGIIITKGDVYFDEYNGADAYKTVKEFNGIIITGGKVYINNTVTNINSSELCKTIMGQVILKAKDCTSDDASKKSEALKAIKVLELFKDYEEDGETYRKIYNDPSLAPELTGDDFRTISTIDYSDVLRYNNWMRNVD